MSLIKTLEEIEKLPDELVNKACLHCNIDLRHGRNSGFMDVEKAKRFLGYIAAETDAYFRAIERAERYAREEAAEKLREHVEAEPSELG